ncbi:unnamed protein product [Ambrosiozyma monospora]|uniref:Unnamed protein product n=1 Tax=Ambrosiozyma monospora TaxID=43982 RepID=A0ACB5SU54_AMBMO|nr:unnamed protein product [Ambrosiozyma monospora]
MGTPVDFTGLPNVKKVSMSFRVFEHYLTVLKYLQHCKQVESVHFSDFKLSTSFPAEDCTKLNGNFFPLVRHLSLTIECQDPYNLYMPCVMDSPYIDVEAPILFPNLYEVKQKECYHSMRPKFKAVQILSQNSKTGSSRPNSSFLDKLTDLSESIETLYLKITRKPDNSKIRRIINQHRKLTRGPIMIAKFKFREEVYYKRFLKEFKIRLVPGRSTCKKSQAPTLLIELDKGVLNQIDECFLIVGMKTFVHFPHNIPDSVRTCEITTTPKIASTSERGSPLITISSPFAEPTRRMIEVRALRYIDLKPTWRGVLILTEYELYRESTFNMFNMC